MILHKYYAYLLFFNNNYFIYIKMFYVIICFFSCVIFLSGFLFIVLCLTDLNVSLAKQYFLLIFDKFLTHSNARVRFFQEPTKYFDMRYNSKQIYYLQNHSDYFKITKSYTLSDNPELPLGNPMYNNRLQNITQSNPLLIHR